MLRVNPNPNRFCVQVAAAFKKAKGEEAAVQKDVLGQVRL